jgi:hypothetical protein
MRARRLCTILLTGVLAAASAAPAKAAHRAKPRCMLPAGWRVVTQNRQTVVIRQRHKPEPVYEYCNRAVRSGWRQLTMTSLNSTGSFFEPASPLLAGRYLAFAWVMEPPQGSAIELWDTRSGQHNSLTVGGFVASFSLPTLLLSPNGVAAAIDVSSRYMIEGGQYVAQPPGASVDVLTLQSKEQNLDGASPPSQIANLQLYDCAAGCTPNTTTVAWTNGGQQHYAQITP